MMEKYKIASVRAAEGGARLLVTVEKEAETGRENEVFVLLAARLSHLPARGEISEETYLALRREAAVSTALTAGMRMLGAGSNSAVRLAQKLRARGVAPDVSAAAVAELERMGLLDETKSALREAQRGAAKYWGDRRILADLRAKGYAAAGLAAAAEWLAGEDSVARCRALVRHHRLAPPRSPAEAQKFFAALARRGYTAAEIRAALQEKC